MKKIALIICAGLMALVSCNKEIASPDQGVTASTPIVFNLSVTHPDGGATKAVKTKWENGDVVFVFFSGATAPKYLKLTYDSSTEKWSSQEMDGDSTGSLGLADGATGTMTAVYLPFGSGATVKKAADGTSYLFDKTYYSYYLTGQLPYTVSGGEVSGTFSMKIPEGFVQFFVYVPASYFDKPVELREPHLTPQGIGAILQSGEVLPATLAQGAPLPGYVYKKEGTSSDEWGFVFSGILASGARNTETKYHCTMVYDGWNGSYFSYSFTKQIYRGERDGRALKLPDSGWTPIDDYKPIDLGCDVGDKRIYWCSRNIGAQADSPADADESERKKTYGDYFAWGEAEPFYLDGHSQDISCSDWKTGKTGYDWASLQYNPSGDGATFTRYTGGDYATLLDEDDAARHCLGSPWRMPTFEEWTAIRDEVNFTWTWDPVNRGRVVTSNVPGYDDGRSVFFPAAGFRTDTDLWMTGRVGQYWASSLDTEYPSNGRSASFNDLVLSKGSLSRREGNPVRAVMD